MSGKHIIGMSKAVAARQGTMGQFLFTGLPGKGQPIDGRLLLSFGSQRTTAGAAMGRVFSRYVALSVTAHHRTPEQRVARRGIKRLQSFSETWNRSKSLKQRGCRIKTVAFRQLDRKIC